MTTKNRRKCQKCRLDRCRFSGMSQAAILTEEQKKKRFRKMLQRREREQHGSSSQTSGTAPDPAPHPAGLEARPESQSKLNSTFLTPLLLYHKHSRKQTTTRIADPLWIKMADPLFFANSLEMIWHQYYKSMFMNLYKISP